MDKSVMGGGLLQGSTGMILDLDHPMHRHYPSMIPQPLNPQPHQLPPGSMTLSTADQSMSLYDLSPSKAAVAAGGMAVPSGIAFRTKLGSSSPSEDDDDHDASFNTDDAGPRSGKKGGGGGPSSSSPWQRMKWTDDMVRLLISVVACVGDDGAPEDSPTVGSKRKLPGGGCSGGAHALQKKGKWKTVSKLMMERGCYVSPQQCEDKFNDLNKRYKRLNDILGRGTTCQVVENPSLLDSVPGVSPKAKDDVRKILASKHLFYREMCAYHNGQRIPNPHDGEPLPSCAAIVAVPSLPLKNESCDADGGGSGGTVANEQEDEDDDEDDLEDHGDGPTGSGRSIDLGKVVQSNYQSDFFQAQMDAALRDAKSAWEVQEWIKKRALQLQEERVEIQVEALELEKRRFKWQRFCNNKDRELERLRLENERMGLENERMSMQLRLKEAELVSGKSTSAIGGDLGGSFHTGGQNCAHDG